MEEIRNDKIQEVDIAKAMEKSYIAYSMSVIVSRALPDVRDGLKPVHRRILYSMYDMGFSHDKPHRKSARIVGEVMGKYHPHGDSAIYNSMVRLAQDFSTRYLLVDGHGNFGSLDGDMPAAMRYTEARMSALSDELLRDINKKTVDFYPNFDETLMQPVVLPSRFPNLLVNGSTGIAVGMTTSIPPHNLGEVVDACVKMIDDPETTMEDILDIIKGPDFPTGALIMGREAVRRSYRTGQGKVRVRSRVEIEESSKGRYRIVVKEIPYMVNKTRLMEGIADLVKTRKIDGITELRDESNMEGVRIVMEVRRDANANVIVNQLFKHSALQGVFSMIFIALENGEPKVFNLKQLLEKYLEHQRDVETRRVQFDLNKAQERAHIVEGLLKALDHIDAIIKTIRESYDDARERLMENFGFSEIQAQSILNMQLRRLQGLEYDKLDAELQELRANIDYYQRVLADEGMLMNIIKEQLLAIKEKYNDPRRTTIEAFMDDLEDEDLIEERDMIITLTRRGYIKRVAQDTYHSQNRGGRGIAGLSMRDEDVVYDMFSTSTHSHLLYITNRGRLYRQKAYYVPETSRQSKGTPIVNLLQLNSDEWVTNVIPVDVFDDRTIVVATKWGMINRIKLTDLDTNRVSGLNFVRLDEGDEIMAVRLSHGKSDVFVATKKGMAIRFRAEDVRTLGRNTRGVRAIKLQVDDEVVSMDILNREGEILTITENGYGKRTPISMYRPQGRNGQGIINYKLTEKTGDVIFSACVSEDEEILLINSQGTVIRLRVRDISSMGRNTSGVSVMRLDEGAKIISATIAKENGVEEE